MVENINLKDIDLSSMNLAHVQGTKSKVYIDGEKCYKILSGLYSSEKIKLLEKINDMSSIKIDGILFPIELILDNGNFIGYTMNYFDNSLNLYDYFTKSRYVDVNDIFKATKKASLILKNAHNSGIVLQDFSFDNILINNESIVKICDVDGCMYKEHKGPFISNIMHHYYDFLMRKRYNIDANFDNQALLLSMLLTIYHKMVYSMEEYDLLLDKIETLKRIRDVYNSLLNSVDNQIPYLDEVICDDDHFIIDRNKQISLKQRLKKDYKIY